MKKILSRDGWVLLVAFLLSRFLIRLAAVHLDFGALYRDWQYLDVYTLQHNLIKGIWYDHTQPPLFNLFLGLIVKLTGSHAQFSFALVLKLITFCNALLLLNILKRTIKHAYIPLLFSLLYLLSPASLIFENELFYTTTVTFLLLMACYFLLNLGEKINARNAAGFFLSLTMICLTRSMYHILWLIGLSVLLLIIYRKKEGLRMLYIFSILSVLIVGSWYVKNYMIFHKFVTSTWTGMNLARNVFHDADAKDSSRIEAFEPFSKISAYSAFRPPVTFQQQYAGLNDRDLLQEMKNDSFINEKHVDYIVIADAYMAACKKQIKAHPVAYAKNVVQSAIAFFAPATRYPTTEFQVQKIKYYDLLYSFNLSHFAKGKQQRRIALVISAIPKMIIYFFVFFLTIRLMIRKKRILLLHLFIMGVIAYLFLVSSFFEHYENMRFRYEAEPLFLVLAAFVTAHFLQNKRKLKMDEAPALSSN